MSFGYAIGDVIAVTQLAWNTVQNARKTCGEHDELTREVLSLHVVLRRLEQEVEKPENPINDVNSGGTHREELRVIFGGCKKVLNILDQVLTKYNALGTRKDRQEAMATDTLWKWQDDESGRNEGQVDVLHISYVSVLEHGVSGHDGKGGTTNE